MQKATKIVGIVWGVLMAFIALSFLFAAMIYGIVALGVGAGSESAYVLNIMTWVFFGVGMACFVPVIFSFLIVGNCNPKRGSKSGKIVLGILAIIFGATAPGIMEIILSERANHE